MTAASSTCANGIQLTFKMRMKMQSTTLNMVQQQDLMAINSYNYDGLSASSLHPASSANELEAGYRGNNIIN